MLNIGDKTDGAAGATGQVNGDEFDSCSFELQNAVTISGQTLSGANLEQLAEAMAINAGVATTFVDSGTANTVELTPITGSAGIKIPTTFTLLNGYRVFFYVANTNTGNMTLNIGQTAGTLLGSKKLLQSDGSEIPAGSITAGKEIQAIYDPTADAATGAWIVSQVLGLAVPVGTVLAAASATVPLGFLACEGASISRATYADLFAVLGTLYGNVDANTFNLPDYRGEFLRGYDNGAGNDPDAISRTDAGGGTTGDNVGTKQLDVFQGHYHTTVWSSSATLGATGEPVGSNIPNSASSSNTVTRSPVTDGVNGAPRTSSETRSRNVTVKYIIKT